MDALMANSTLKKNVKVLQHTIGLMARELSRDEMQELEEAIDRFREGHSPLIMPITLIQHYVHKYDHPFLKEQYYLYPHPVEIQLKNHV